MPRTPSKTKRCSLPECDRPHEAKDYCRPHYRRWRLYGDPYGSAPVGGIPTIPSELRCSGLTYRQLRHWCEVGYLQAPVAPNGRTRKWDPAEVKVALIMARLVAVVGLPHQLAAQVARAAVAGRPRRELAPGVALTINVRKATR